MTFLNPAVLIGLLAASVPVIIHLLNLRKIERVEFSTLFFLRELQKSKIRRLKIKQIVLLVLRTLIVILLVLAFARPTLKGIRLTDSSATAKTTAVIVFDDTPSMALFSGNATNFNLMKRTVHDILNSFENGDEIFLIPLSDAQAFKFSDVNRAQTFIEQKKLSDLPGDLYKALNKAKILLKRSVNANKEFYILSDFQKNLFSRKYEDKTALQDLSAVYLSVLKLSSESNFAVSNFSLRNKILQIGKTVYFSLELKRYGAPAGFRNAVTLFIDGKKQARRSVPPTFSGTAQIVLNATLEKGGINTAMIELGDDAFAYDNSNKLIFYVPEKIKTALIFKDKNDFKFVKIALAANDSGLVAIDEFNVRLFNSIPLNKYDVIFLAGYSEEINLPKLKSYLKNGGGLVFLPSLLSDSKNLNRLASGLGLPKFGTQMKTDNNTSINAFGKVDFAHPLFEGMFKKKRAKGIESPDFYKYFVFNAKGKGLPVVSLEDGSAFLSEFEIGKGRLLVFNTPFALQWSNFPLKGFFAPLITRCVFYLSSNGGKNRALTVGSKAEINIAKIKIPELKVVRPDGVVEKMVLEKQRRNYLIYDKFDKVGIYKFYSGGKLVDYFAVNPSPQESELKTFKRKEIEKFFAKEFPDARLTHLKNGEDVKSIIQRARFGTELWKYFLILVLLLAVAEMLVARNSKNDLADLQSLTNDRK
jgi:hypothetical protein